MRNHISMRFAAILLGVAAVVSVKGWAQPPRSFRELMKQYTADLKADKLDADAAAKVFRGDLEELMHVMKPGPGNSRQLGFWYAGFEKIIQLNAREGPSKYQLEKRPELAELGYLVQTLGRIAVKMPNEKARKQLEQWNGYVKELDAGGKNLVAISKAGSAKEIQKAFIAINNTCNNCHAAFR